jgi:hypothetical protein
MTQSFDLAQSYVTALTGHPDTVMEWRAINDKDKGVAAHTLRGTIREMFPTLQQYNNGGWGIFVCINSMDGKGRELANVEYIRTHVVDMDNPLSSGANYEIAIKTYPQPHFAVQSSPGKFHLYWLVEHYVGNDFYTFQQRKLAQLYDGDKSIIDPTRVLRVPGFYHLKAEPYLTNWWGLHGGARWPVAALADSLAHINVINHIGVRSALGDPEMQAPSLEWLKFGLNLINPNELDRQEWLSISAAFKQAGWTLADENTLLGIWQAWCAQYSRNDAPENIKLWYSVRETEVGWDTFKRRTAINAYLMHHGIQNVPPLPAVRPAVALPADPAQPWEQPAQEIKREELGELLNADECKVWFKDCYFIARTGEIFSPAGRYMNSSQFNGLYGGKHFIITTGGKATDEAWKAALRSTSWTIPKVDHIRFLPTEKPFAIIKDRMGRKGLNTYIPIEYDATPGDVTPFLDHFKRILPNDIDRNIWLSYMAHCVKFPGYKIPWAPLLQSAEGIGKTMFFKIMQHALGEMYVYTPNAQELVSSGSKFNAWMRGKLCIMVNEIKVDERRELIEILKPMITDEKVEVQAKGQDQEMEDNPANWMFFSNFKDAIPISKNGRRYAISFSVLQTADDILRAGMDDAYFIRLWDWLDGGGYQALTHWLLNYPIEKGSLPKRAPETSSRDEALRISRSPMQVVAEESIQDGVQGFRGGYISSIALTRRVVATGVKAPSAHSIRSLLEGMGYSELGRAVEIYPFEDITSRPIIYTNRRELTLQGYGRAQGYEILGN